MWEVSFLAYGGVRGGLLTVNAEEKGVRLEI